ncbi:MAG: type IV secretory system conjugative DNA transfer family protein [Acidimicrobiales bacterium]
MSTAPGARFRPPPGPIGRGPASGRPRVRGEAVAVAVVAGLAGLSWVAGGCATLAAGHGWHEVPPASSLGLLVGLLAHPGAPASAWPAPVRRLLPSAVVFWLVFALLGLAGGAVAAAVMHRTRSRVYRGRPVADIGAVWATSAELRGLTVNRPGAGRLVIGRCGRRLVAVEPGQSLLVAGPTQSGKTSGLAIPAILEWEGPVIATSVKTDLVRHTARWRESLGPVFVYDPVGVTDGCRAGWSPLAETRDWAGARRVAAGLAAVQRAGTVPEDAAFWVALAEKMLAPMLLAAARSGRSIGDVVRWVDSGEVAEVLDALESAGSAEALRAAQASFSREERQLSSVYATVETLVAAFADPAVAASATSHEICAARLTDGGSATVYLAAPSHEQERLRPVFTAVLRCLLEGAVTKASRDGRLDPPLLVVLDEAANIAPLADLDTLAATASSHGIQLVTVWQDFSQIEARYGARAATVVNNHRAKLVCSGVADPATLEQVSRLIGDEQRQVETLTVDHAGTTSTTRGQAECRLAPAAWLRRIRPGEAVLVYGHLPPARVALRPFWAEAALRRRSEASQPPAPGSVGGRRDPTRKRP